MLPASRTVDVTVTTGADFRRYEFGEMDQKWNLVKSG
jgi:hypothetical protein